MMRKKEKRNCCESWYFREQCEHFTCEFLVTIDYDNEGRMTGHLELRLPKGTHSYDFAHPVNMNLKGSLFLVLDKCVFTEACIHLDIEDVDLSIKGDIYFEREWGRGQIGLQRKIWAMEQELSGELWVNGKEFSFDGGKGYLEEYKRKTPAMEGNYFWTQCNWFGERPFRIVCGSQDRKCFAIINQNSYPIRLAWWKGAKIEYVCGPAFRMRQGRYILEGWRSEETDVNQLDQTVRYRLTHGSDILFDEISRRAMYQYGEQAGLFLKKGV